MQKFIFIDHEGVERVLRAHSLDAAHAAAHRFVLGQSNSPALAAVAMRTVREDTLDAPLGHAELAEQIERLIPLAETEQERERLYHLAASHWEKA